MAPNNSHAKQNCSRQQSEVFELFFFSEKITGITKTRLFKYIAKFHPKNWKISVKNWYFSYFCSKHRLWYSLEPPRRGGSNEYPQSMFLSRYKKNNVYPCKPQFYYIKVGCKGVKIMYDWHFMWTVCTRNVKPNFLWEILKIIQYVDCCSCDWHFKG